MKDEEGVLELFRGSFFTKKDDDVEDEEDLIEMVKKDNSITTIYEEGDTGGQAQGKHEKKSLFKPTGRQQRKRSHEEIEAGPSGLTPAQQRRRMESVTSLENEKNDALDEFMRKGGRRKRTRRRRKKKKKRSKRKKKRSKTKKRKRTKKKRRKKITRKRKYK